MSKSQKWLVALVVIAALVVLNWKDVKSGFMEGYNDSRGKRADSAAPAMAAPANSPK